MTTTTKTAERYALYVARFSDPKYGYVLGAWESEIYTSREEAMRAFEQYPIYARQSLALARLDEHDNVVENVAYRVVDRKPGNEAIRLPFLRKGRETEKAIFMDFRHPRAFDQGERVGAWIPKGQIHALHMGEGGGGTNEIPEWLAATKAII